jgi:hypothetical protein
MGFRLRGRSGGRTGTQAMHPTLVGRVLSLCAGPRWYRVVSWQLPSRQCSPAERYSWFGSMETA